jgi:hypothetical protein
MVEKVRSSKGRCAEARQTSSSPRRPQWGDAASFRCEFFYLSNAIGREDGSVLDRKLLLGIGPYREDASRVNGTPTVARQRHTDCRALPSSVGAPNLGSSRHNADMDARPSSRVVWRKAAMRGICSKSFPPPWRVQMVSMVPVRD